MNIRDIAIIAALGLSSCFAKPIGYNELDAGRPDAFYQSVDAEVTRDSDLPDASPATDSSVPPIECVEDLTFESIPGQDCNIRIGVDSEGDVFGSLSGQKIHYQEIDATGLPEYVPENFPIAPGEFIVSKKEGGSLPGQM